jgi:hypothetical protein
MYENTIIKSSENILDYLLNHLISISGNNFNIPTIDIIDYSKFNNNRTVFEYEKKNINYYRTLGNKKIRDYYFYLIPLCRQYLDNFFLFVFC